MLLAHGDLNLIELSLSQIIPEESYDGRQVIDRCLALTCVVEGPEYFLDPCNLLFRNGATNLSSFFIITVS